MKRKLIRIVVFMLAVVLLSNYVFAVSEYNVQPRFIYLITNRATITIDMSNGIASCSASSGTRQSATVRIVGYLQKCIGGTWYNIKNWSDVGTYSAAIEKTFAIDSGYTYRYIVYTYVYDSSGNLLETATASDSADYYP